MRLAVKGIMMTTEFRHYELRETKDSRIVGTAVRYGDRARILDFEEEILKGAFKYDDVILNIQHNRNRPIARTNGSGLELRDGDTALEIEATLPPTPNGEEAMAMVKAGLLRGLSVEMEVLDELWNATGGSHLRTIRSARLHGIGLVDRPAYPDAAVAMRNKPENLTVPVPKRFYW